MTSLAFARSNRWSLGALMLGLRPMGVFDLTSTAMSASFVGPDEKPDFAPYAVVPTQSIYELNPKVSGLTGAAR